MSDMDSLVRSIPEFREVLLHQVKKSTNEDDRIKLSIMRNYEVFMRPSFERMKPLLKDEGLPENYLSIYMKPLQIKDDNGEDAVVVKKEIEQLLGRPLINYSIGE